MASDSIHCEIDEAESISSLSQRSGINDVENEPALPLRSAYAIAWIIVAWIVGFLVFEMSAIGQESHSSRTFMPRWQKIETADAISESGIKAFPRMQHVSEMMPVLDSVIQNLESQPAKSDAKNRTARIDQIRSAAGLPRLDTKRLDRSSNVTALEMIEVTAVAGTVVAEMGKQADASRAADATLIRAKQRIIQVPLKFSQVFPSNNQ